MTRFVAYYRVNIDKQVRSQQLCHKPQPPLRT